MTDNILTPEWLRANLPPSVRTASQKRSVPLKPWKEGHYKYTGSVELRYDDSCRNGHNTFSITGSVYRQRLTGGRVEEDSFGAFDEAWSKEHAPEFVKYHKWHLCSSDGPLHYLANTLYFAGDRDHHGLRKGEQRQMRDNKGMLVWKRDSVTGASVSSETCPDEVVELRWKPWMRIGEGKERQLDAARRAAIWLDATDEELMAPDLQERLIARLPGLMLEFKTAMEELGFEY